jgi:phenylacetate-CoA ligase
VIILSCCGGLNIPLVAMPIVKWCETHGIPVVLSHRGATTEEELSQSRFTRRAFQYFSRICSAIHVSSPYLQRVLANFGIESIAVPIIIDIPNLHYHPRAPDLSGIVNTRTMQPCHGGLLLIQSFAQIHHDFPNARLTVAGHGSEFKQCLDIAQTLQIEDFINFPGALSTPEVANLLDKGGLLLNTSTADNIPNALLEAFSSGIPVVSSAVGGIPDLIGNDERGFIAHGMEPSDFLNAVKRAVADPELTLQKVAAARKWVEEFSWPVLRPSYLQALIEPLLVAGRNKTSEQGR